MMNGLKKNRGIDNPTKMSGTSVQWIMKTQLEVV